MNNSAHHKFLNYVFLAIALLCLPDRIYGTDYYVRQSGNDKNPGDSAKAAFRTIGRAVSVLGSEGVIYIGAGTYTESVYFDAVKIHKKGYGSAVFFGDTTGVYTGDKGDVIWRTPNTGNNWNILVTNANNIYTTNVQFEGNGITTNGIACYLANCFGQMTSDNCQFRDLQFGIYSYGQMSLSAQATGFENLTYGIYGSLSTAASINKCSFVNSRIGIELNDTSSLEVRSCKFNAKTDAEGIAVAHDAVRAYRSGVIISDCEISSPSIGVYGTDNKYLSIKSCRITEPQSWGVYMTGESLSVTDCQVTGTGQRIGNGIMIGDLAGKHAQIANLSIDGVSIGLLSQYGEYDYQGVTVTNCTIGLYFYPGNEYMLLDGSSKIELKSNLFALYTDHAKDKPGKLELRDREFSGNDYSLLAYHADLIIDSCTFSDNGFGVLTSQCSSIDVRNSKFVKNQREGFAGYGMTADGDRVSVQDCEFNDNLVGLSVRSSADNEPVLQNLVIENNASIGLRIADGRWEWTPKNNISIHNSLFGIYAERMTLNLSGLELADVATYSIYSYQGSLTVSDSTLVGGQIGIYSVYNTSVDFHNTTIKGATSNGIMLYYCPQLRFDGVTSSNNGGIGLYSYAVDKCDFHVANSKFSDNSYAGLWLDGVSVDASVVSNVELNRNTFAMLVQNGDITLTPEMKLTVEGNNYGVMSYGGKFVVKDVKISGNNVGLFQWLGSLEVDGASISSKTFGILAYPGTDMTITNTDVQDASYGIYVLPYQEKERKLKIVDCRITNNSYIGIYVSPYGDSQPVLDIENTTFSGGSYGLYGYNSTLNVTNTAFNDSSASAIVQQQGVGNFQGVTINNTGSWGILAYGDKFTLAGSKLNNAKYGIYLSTLEGSLVNSIVQGGAYGVYANNAKGKYEILQATIANISLFALWHEDGNTLVRNSIIKSDYYGMWNRLNQGILQHDHNVVVAKQPYVNTTAGEAEIQKDPVFKNSAKGDFRLAAGSPAINSGTDLSLVSKIDIDGNSRPSFRQFEMGAYEYTEASGSLRVLQWNEKAK